MFMQTKAAILVNTNHPLVLDEIEIPKLKPGQALIEIMYSGICHTQLLEARGHRGEDPFLPHLLGHEGSGKVIDIGENVTKVKPNDQVILSWMKGSGANVPGSVYQWKGKKVNAGAITTFSKYSIISENRLTKIPLDFSLKNAALLGCALPTGFGSVFNTAKPKPGQSIAIFGCGGIGLCSIIAAKLSSCAPIIAIDIYSEKLKLAKEFGASHIINASNSNPLKEIQKICSLDFAIEATGNTSVMNQAILSIRNQGGCVVIIGNAHHGKTLSIDPFQLNLGKKILGTWGGDNDPDLHFPRYCKLIQHNLLNVDPLITKIYALSDINQALDDLENGKTLRPIINMSLE